MKQYTMQKRLAKRDMHTLYDTAFRNLNALSNKELLRLARDREVSKELRDKANSILWKRLDPQDRDAVEV